MIKPKFNILNLSSLPIFLQLQIEEALLRIDNRNWCIINSGSTSAIVMGISGKPELLINQKLVKDIPIPVIRRFSGGGTVVVDSNTQFVTFICNSKEVNVESFPDKIFQWSEDIYKPVFKDLPFRLRENDYVFDEKKFGGNAQYLRKDRWLHHTSFLWDFDSKNMDYLLMPSKRPKYRESRSHEDFLCTLKQHFPEKVGFHVKVLEELSKKFDVKNVSLNEIEDYLNQDHRKATTFVEI